MKARRYRYHPLTILLQLWKLAKNAIFFVIYLFVIKTGSESPFIVYGRYIFVLAVGLSVCSIFFKWFTQKYELDDRSFHLYKGVFNKSEQTIPFSKVQNINRHTSLFHKLFNMTSVSFETGMAGDDAAVKFAVISQAEADRIEVHMAKMIKSDEPEDSEEWTAVPPVDGEIEATSTLDSENMAQERTIHFTPTKNDIFKAAFTSLSFLLFIPVILSLYEKIDGVFNVGEKAEGIVQRLLSSGWLMMILIIVFIIASTIFGLVRTFLKYGKYEISSDLERIYISKGMMDETSFSISKDRVQAIEIEQSMIKRWLGLAEVKLISAGSLESNKSMNEINSLYPFLPIQRAYEMVSEILPSYQVTQEMTRLPTKALWLRLFRPSWFWMAVTAGLFYFKPTILQMKEAWWMISAILLIIVLVARWLDFLNTRYILNDRFIQIKTGSLTTTLYISKRDKVIEVKVTQSKLQRLLGLASIGTINRAKPVHHTGVKDVPLGMAESFYKWYIGRRTEITVE
ncbi:PH domain-containing protein [Paenibacillus lentus]|uniref:YdbS-like PH domain-containing protein n=1 Tax=Paenibacillus lentus TaxID=1338368 RepID=A0A3Q8SEJ7_9BACL|nr:PH domain-containing protein [Paenibacillus lentus]AZK48916.1 hypothetical protein EIM92_07725 [Paenibacillus lentus]